MSKLRKKLVRCEWCGKEKTCGRAKVDELVECALFGRKVAEEVVAPIEPVVVVSEPRLPKTFGRWIKSRYTEEEFNEFVHGVAGKVVPKVRCRDCFSFEHNPHTPSLGLGTCATSNRAEWGGKERLCESYVGISTI